MVKGRRTWIAVAALIALAAGCGESESGSGEEPERSSSLPRATHSVARPAGAVEVVRRSARDAWSVDGVAVESLVEALAPLADADRDTDNFWQASRTTVRISVDADSDWAVVVDAVRALTTLAMPGVFLDDPCFDPPDELPEINIYSVTSDEKAIINVGSVGQPRDRDPRLCYAVVYEKGESPEGYDPPDVGEDEYCTTLEFVRFEYDIEKAARKIFDTPDLDDFLGTRLFEEGRKGA